MTRLYAILGCFGIAFESFAICCIVYKMGYEAHILEVLR